MRFHRFHRGPTNGTGQHGGRPGGRPGDRWGRKALGPGPGTPAARTPQSSRERLRAAWRGAAGRFCDDVQCVIGAPDAPLGW